MACGAAGASVRGSAASSSAPKDFSKSVLGAAMLRRYGSGGSKKQRPRQADSDGDAERPFSLEKAVVGEIKLPKKETSRRLAASKTLGNSPKIAEAFASRRRCKSNVPRSGAALHTSRGRVMAAR